MNENKTEEVLAEVVSDVQIPLDNLAYTVEAYLMANGTRLDIETRLLLAGIRDCAGRVAGSVREIARAHPGGLPPSAPVFQSRFMDTH